MGEDGQGMDYLVASNPTFQKLRMCGQNGHVPLPNSSYIRLPTQVTGHSVRPGVV